MCEVNTNSLPGCRNLLLSAFVALALMTGCRSTTPDDSSVVVPMRETNASLKTEEEREPGFVEFEQDGRRYLRGAIAFPTGNKSSSGLLLEKVVPAEVTAGNSFQYFYYVRNLTDHQLATVKVVDRVSDNFIPSDAVPKATSAEGGIATWELGELGPKETREIRVTGVAKEKGSILTCGWATYSPILCMPIQVNQASAETNAGQSNLNNHQQPSP